MSVLIAQQYGRDKLIQAFQKEGQEVVKILTKDVKLIVPTVEEELPTMSRMRDFFGSMGIKVMVSSPDTIDICRDKAEFYRFCRRHGFQTPLTAQFDAVAKPRFGKGSKGIIHLDRSYIIQDFIPWPEYSIDYFGDFEGNFLSAIPRIRMNIINGESHSGNIDMNPIIIEKARQIGTDLKLVGVNTIQGFFQDSVFLFSEINCRFGGGFWLTQSVYPTVKKLLELCGI